MKDSGILIRKKKSSFIVVFTIFAVVGYVIFLSSKLWFPTMSDLVPVTPLYEKQKVANYNLYLTAWQYADKDDAMEIILEKENSDVLDMEFSYAAVERTAGDLHMKVVSEEPKYVVLRITGIDKNWREVSLRVTPKGGDEVRFYTNKEKVEMAPSLPIKTDSGYQIGRLEKQISYNQNLIDKNTKATEKLQKENEKLEKKLKEFAKTEYLTAEQLQENEDLIVKAQSKITANRETMDGIQKNSDTIADRNIKIKEQITALSP